MLWLKWIHVSKRGPKKQNCVYILCRSVQYTRPRPWASYQIRKIARCACPGNAGNVFPRRRFQRKPIVSDPGMHHGTCVTHVPWCMSGSLTCGDGKNVPGIPGACARAILRIWQEAHVMLFMWLFIWKRCMRIWLVRWLHGFQLTRFRPYSVIVSPDAEG